ncbi:hypothetical protein GKIL_3481 [Gloeobacter kilaueensis JS1]|uniref:Uncharacterized protein n=1 Tax=Gloeobacter kilaueensis (strain ATCC BAA-2537 / CCAP 1431/1 / ULC 316 / JS1) TaxID=1183438 RepID=U5QL56_GLOK1|nr:hypothetical protein GKIL_3481 [Gloeobacter kilaueensis JS1]
MNSQDNEPAWLAVIVLSSNSLCKLLFDKCSMFRCIEVESHLLSVLDDFDV